MMFDIPGLSAKVRVFEEVKTKDDQYNIVDCGIQYEDGGIDSVALGGSFYSVKNLCGQLDKKAAKKAKKAAKAQKALAKKKAAKKAAKKALKKAAKRALKAVITTPTPKAPLMSDDYDHTAGVDVEATSV